jgi:hypothetical protein
MAYGLADIVTIGRDGVRVVAGWTEPVTLAPVTAPTAITGRKIPGETYERVLMAHATFTADATVLTRNPTLDILDGAGAVQYQVALTSGVLASTSAVVYAAINGADGRAAAGISTVRIPDLLLPPGFTVQFNSGAEGAADTWTLTGLLVQRYPSNLVAVLQGSGS